MQSLKRELQDTRDECSVLERRGVARESESQDTAGEMRALKQKVEDQEAEVQSLKRQLEQSRFSGVPDTTAGVEVPEVISVSEREAADSEDDARRAAARRASANAGASSGGSWRATPVSRSYHCHQRSPVASSFGRRASSAASFGDGSRQSAWRICHCRRPQTSVHCSHEPRVAQHGGAPPPRVPHAAAGASRSAPRPPPRRRQRTRFLSAPTCRLGRGAASDAAAPRAWRRGQAWARARAHPKTALGISAARCSMTTAASQSRQRWQAAALRASARPTPSRGSGCTEPHCK